jgi:hypothetical protein
MVKATDVIEEKKSFGCLDHDKSDDQVRKRLKIEEIIH